MAINVLQGRRPLAWPALAISAEALRARELLAHDPDAAALALDGALRLLLYQAGSEHPGALLAPDAMLHDLDVRHPELARRFRLALRAPNVGSRLAHLWALIELVNSIPLSEAASRP